MDNSKKKPKSISERHKRRTLDFSLPHIKIVGVIAFIALLSLIVSLVLDHFEIPFWSSILANIFAGLLTGLVICVISGTKQVAIPNVDEAFCMNTPHVFSVGYEFALGKWFGKWRIYQFGGHLDSIYEKRK